MAVTPGTEPILAAARQWRDRCLINEGSVFADARLWTADHLDDLNRYYVENMQAGSGTFLEKLQVQLAPADPGAKRLAAEMLWVMMLFPNNINRETKRNLVITSWEWSGAPFPRDHSLLDEPLRQGIGSGGRDYNSYGAGEMEFFVILMRDFRSRPRQEQEELLADPWRFGAWLDTIPGAQNRQFRHMLLHLLFPDDYERVSSTRHKTRIDNAFASVLDGGSDRGASYLDRDRRLLQIRRALQEEYPDRQLDFYYPPLNERWSEEEEDQPPIPPNGDGGGKISEPKSKGWQAKQQHSYIEPAFSEIVAAVARQGLRISEQTLRRYHLALKVRGFVILSGVSGTGKTWLGEAYSRAVGAEHLIVPVAPNWTTNEDLLGYLNPLDGQYHDTAFSRFLREAAAEYEQASTSKGASRPYHLVLDEMNLARVEYYFARFLSAMEIRARHGTAAIELGPKEHVLLSPNLRFIGTVNVDETTHGFADKVYDRAQLIELEAPREALAEHLAGAVHGPLLLQVWDAVSDVAPFAFRVVDEIGHYLEKADGIGASWEELLDEQILQKILPKLKGANPRVGEALARLDKLTAERFPLSHAKVRRIQHGFVQHGFASFF